MTARMASGNAPGARTRAVLASSAAGATTIRAKAPIQIPTVAFAQEDMAAGDGR